MIPDVVLKHRCIGCTRIQFLFLSKWCERLYVINILFLIFFLATLKSISLQHKGKFQKQKEGLHCASTPPCQLGSEVQYCSLRLTPRKVWLASLRTLFSGIMLGWVESGGLEIPRHLYNHVYREEVTLAFSLYNCFLYGSDIFACLLQKTWLWIKKQFVLSCASLKMGNV